MATGITTYCDGFEFLCTRTVTRGDYAALCDAVAAEPEDNSEGGLLFLRSPTYKTLRHHVKLPENSVRGKAGKTPWTGWKRGHHFAEWPLITDGVMPSWRGCAEVLWPAGAMAYTTLKAFDHAPAWTLAELKAVSDAMWTTCGIVVRRVPRASQLRHT